MKDLFIIDGLVYVARKKDEVTGEEKFYIKDMLRTDFTPTETQLYDIVCRVGRKLNKEELIKFLNWQN